MSTFIKDFIEKATIDRRRFLLATAAGVGGVMASGALGAGRVLAADQPAVAWSYRDRSSPYWNYIVSGGESFVESLGRNRSELINLINNGSSEKSLADVRSLLTRTGGKLALAIDPNDAPNARPVVEACAAAGAHVSTIWNKTADLHPWDFGDNYVSHMSWSDEGPAEQTAKILIEAMGGKGGIVGLGGIPSNNPAIERQAGLMKALAAYPEVQLLDYQAADWDTQKANQIMAGFLTRFGSDIKGVFAANDVMAYGVNEALRADGMTDIPVVAYDGNLQAVEMVMRGELLATVSTNPYWGGGVTAALAYHAAIGTFKPSEEPKEHREFYGPTILITRADAADFKRNYLDTVPKYDWKDFWGQSRGQIQYR
jgi:ribose transport system substrate-binding protein